MIALGNPSDLANASFSYLNKPKCLQLAGCAISYQPHYWLSHNRFMQVSGCSPGLISDISKGRTRPIVLKNTVFAADAKFKACHAK
jgi:hypothetical protein